MNRKLRLTFLLIAMFVAFTAFISATYAFLTDSNNTTFNYRMDSINASVNVSGNTLVTVNNFKEDHSLAYIDAINDFIYDRYSLLKTMATEWQIAITTDNNYATRAKVRLTDLTNNNNIEGLLYLFIIEDSTKLDQDITLIIEDGYLKWHYVGDTTQINNMIDLSSIQNTIGANPINETLQNTINPNLRTLVNNYNLNLLSTLYEGDDYKLYPTAEVNAEKTNAVHLRLLIWGDYYNLVNKNNYLTRTFDINLNINVIQAIDDYGGEPDYETD